METATKPPRTHLGAALRSARERASISQDAVGSACGLARGYISDVESGRRSLRDGRLVVIERYIGCEPGLLVRAAARDRGGITLPTGSEDRDDVVVSLALRWHTLSASKIAAIRALLAG